MQRNTPSRVAGWCAPACVRARVQGKLLPGPGMPLPVPASVFVGSVADVLQHTR